MKIAHEAPISIFEKVQELTSYDYCLAHLYNENDEYRSKFLQAKAKGREIILDTSVFELGHAFDQEKYVQIIKQLQPTYYILPDILEQSQKTINSSFNFVNKYPNLPGKKIGVIQGKSFEELIQCYKTLSIFVDVIAISFDYSYYLTEVQDESLNNFYKYMLGRQKFIKKLLSHPIYKHAPKPIHLLGCALPQEFIAYKGLEQIVSLDTSNPVVHGLLSIPYSLDGLTTKNTIKLFTMINQEVKPDQLSIVEQNIKKFKQFVK